MNDNMQDTTTQEKLFASLGTKEKPRPKPEAMAEGFHLIFDWFDSVKEEVYWLERLYPDVRLDGLKAKLAYLKNDIIYVNYKTAEGNE